jgi:hypothetical protein
VENMFNLGCFVKATTLACIETDTVEIYLPSCIWWRESTLTLPSIRVSARLVHQDESVQRKGHDTVIQKHAPPVVVENMRKYVRVVGVSNAHEKDKLILQKCWRL